MTCGSRATGPFRTGRASERALVATTRLHARVICCAGTHLALARPSPGCPAGRTPARCNGSPNHFLIAMLKQALAARFARFFRRRDGECVPTGSAGVFSWRGHSPAMGARERSRHGPFMLLHGLPRLARRQPRCRPPLMGSSRKPVYEAHTHCTPVLALARCAVSPSISTHQATAGCIRCHRTAWRLKPSEIRHRPSVAHLLQRAG
jgi:hypothetical protein